MIASNKTRFSIGTTCVGYEVVDCDGRPVTETYDNTTIASNIADELNEAAQRGKSSLARALGALEYEV